MLLNDKVHFCSWVHSLLDKVYCNSHKRTCWREQTHRADHLIHICCQCEDSLTLLVSLSCQFFTSLYCSYSCIIDLNFHLRTIREYSSLLVLSVCLSLQYNFFICASKKDFKDKHQPILSWVHELERRRSKAHTSTCWENTLARVSQAIYFITVWSDTKSTVIPLSQGYTRSLCLILCKKMLWSCFTVLPGANNLATLSE